MEALVAVLLYLVLIFSPGKYTTTQIYTIEQQHQAQVDAVENDPVLYNYVKLEYADEAQRVIVVNAEEN